MERYKKDYNNINVNPRLSESFDLPLDFLEVKTGLKERIPMRSDSDNETFFETSDESGYDSNEEMIPDTDPRHIMPQTMPLGDINQQHEGGAQRHSRHITPQTVPLKDVNQQHEGGDQHQGSSNDEVMEDQFDLDDVDSNLDDSPAGLRKAIHEKYHTPAVGTVIGYRRCGPLYFQCLVRYGNENAPTYRMVPGGSAGL